MRAVAPERIDWGTTEELLLTLIRLTDRGQLWFHDVHRKKGSKRPPALEIHRPGDEPKKTRRPATSEEMKAFFGAGGIRYTGKPSGRARATKAKKGGGTRGAKR